MRTPEREEICALDASGKNANDVPVADHAVGQEFLAYEIDLAAGAPTTDEQREAAFKLLEDRGWMTYHIEPVWHDRRYTLTERGMTALEGM